MRVLFRSLWRQEGRDCGRVQEDSTTEKNPGSALPRHYFPAGREDGARKEAGENEDPGVQLHFRLRTPDRWWNYVVPLLGDCVRIPCFERAAHSPGDRRITCRIGFAGQGLSGVGEFRAN